MPPSLPLSLCAPTPSPPLLLLLLHRQPPLLHPLPNPLLPLLPLLPMLAPSVEVAVLGAWLWACPPRRDPCS